MDLRSDMKYYFLFGRTSQDSKVQRQHISVDLQRRKAGAKKETQHVIDITCLSLPGLVGTAHGHMSVRRKLQPGSQRHPDLRRQGASRKEFYYHDCSHRLLPPHGHYQLRHGRAEVGEQRLASSGMGQ